jgi:subtilisin family serine protease
MKMSRFIPIVLALIILSTFAAGDENLSFETELDISEGVYMLEMDSIEIPMNATFTLTAKGVENIHISLGDLKESADGTNGIVVLSRDVPAGVYDLVVEGDAIDDVSSVNLRITAKTEDGWKLLIKDPDESFKFDIKSIYAKNDSSKLYFRVEYYQQWNDSNEIDTAIFLDTNQNQNTGLNNSYGWYEMNDIGADYVAVIGREGNSIWKWVNEGWDTNYASYAYLDLKNGTDYFEIGINLDDINNASKIDIIANNIEFGDAIHAIKPDHSTYIQTRENNLVSRLFSFERKYGVVPGEVIVGFDKTIKEHSESLITTYGGEILDRNEALNCVLVRVEDTESFMEGVRRYESIAYVEPNGIVHALYTPNDSKWNRQWGPKSIHADEAWDVVRGDRNINISIVDTGIDYNHVDLKRNYVNGGWDWVNLDGDPMDDDGHGTHCAGIAAATMDNRRGIAGVAQVGIMAEKVLNETGEGSLWDVSQGIMHAVNKDANIISMSLGGDSSYTMKKACGYAWDEGCVLVAAAGNDNSYGICYPAAYNTVISVGAIDRSDSLSDYSNWGPEMELVAPGDGIISTFPDGEYAIMSGTSMAAPHVSGVAALVWSRYPTCTNSEIRGILDDSADDLGSTGYDEYYGYGKVNASAALRRFVPEGWDYAPAACDGHMTYPPSEIPGFEGILSIIMLLAVASYISAKKR